ncbi:unnamed protein product [Urochloa humidicola]
MLKKKMLDYLYTSQYQMRGILAVSLGCIEDRNSENFTHAVFMRFQQKEDIAKFQSSAYYSKILDEHVKPVSYGLSVSVDFEPELEDDIIPLFRRGEDFNCGVQFMLLFFETASQEAREDASSSLQRLISQWGSFIVQATCGCCLDPENGYNHAAVIRFPSFDDLKLFRESMEYWQKEQVLTHPVELKPLRAVSIEDLGERALQLGPEALGLPPVKKNENKEGSSLTMLLEKQGHGSEDQHPGNNNVSSSSFSTREEASVKPKIA